MVSGICEDTGGYPLGAACPFVCPLCRGPLDWSGACERCHGCSSGRREDWRFPGDRYDAHDDKGRMLGDGQHWIRTDGPRAAVSARQNAANMAELREMLGVFDTAVTSRSRLGIPEIDPDIRGTVERRGRP